MRNFFVGFMAIMTAISIIRNLKAIIGVSILVVAVGFVYLLYTNDMNIDIALSELTAHIKVVMGWFKAMFDRYLLPFKPLVTFD